MPDTREWLEVDGLGGFASGTASLIPTRRYHSLLTSTHCDARSGGLERFALLQGCDVWLETELGRFPLTSFSYAEGIISPDLSSQNIRFEHRPWPNWEFRLAPRVKVRYELFMTPGVSRVFLRWSLRGSIRTARLFVRPLLAARNFHQLHLANSAFNFSPYYHDERSVAWIPYEAAPKILTSHNGEFHSDPSWYYRFAYEVDRQRGYEYHEDLASPGIFSFQLSLGPALCIFAASTDPSLREITPTSSINAHFEECAATEASRRSAFDSEVHLSASQYFISVTEHPSNTTRTAPRSTIIAGYPWFTDWGRDTCISVRGLAIALGDYQRALDVLYSWSLALSEGMIPNRFPDSSAHPEYNSVDASLWFIIALGDLLSQAPSSIVSSSTRAHFGVCCEQILRAYRNGTRHMIRVDSDGLLGCGNSRVQLTWMDAKIGDEVVTPRAGKPIEIQALWINAMQIANTLWPETFRELDLPAEIVRASAAVRSRFWDPHRKYLLDVVDVDHQSGNDDASFRPNQIFACGGLPYAILPKEICSQVVTLVEQELVTRLGLRTLSRRDFRYVGRYEGSPTQRDRRYHQGTVWPWLLGPFVEAWVGTRDRSTKAKQEARKLFLNPLLRQLASAGLGHLTEIADGDEPFYPRGAPFQAWSLAEAIRLDRVVLR